MSERIDDWWAKADGQSGRTIPGRRCLNKRRHSGTPPQTPEFSALGPGLALKQNRRVGGKLASRANAGCRTGARVALQRGPIFRPGSRRVMKASGSAPWAPN
jgi:hypothetical protein